MNIGTLKGIYIYICIYIYIYIYELQSVNLFQRVDIRDHIRDCIGNAKESPVFTRNCPLLSLLLMGITER